MVSAFQRQLRYSLIRFVFSSLTESCKVKSAYISSAALLMHFCWWWSAQSVMMKRKSMFESFLHER